MATKPTKAAIAKLKEDPILAPEFDGKYGAGAASLHLNHEFQERGGVSDL